MRLLIGISTMNDSIYSLIEELKKIENPLHIIISHQITNDKEYPEDYGNEFITVIAKQEKGLSKSRNVLIDYGINNEFDYLIISDDDVKYDTDNIKLLQKYLDQNINKARHYQFKSSDEKGNDRKQYSSKPFLLSWTDIFKVSSIEMCLNLELVNKFKLRFDERFGLGAVYPVGEEAVFLADAYNQNNDIYFIPYSITIHPIESTGTQLFTNPLMVTSRGAMFVRCFGKLKGFILTLAFWVKKFLLRKQRNNDLTKLQSLKLIMGGYFNNGK